MFNYNRFLDDMINNNINYMESTGDDMSYEVNKMLNAQDRLNYLIESPDELDYDEEIEFNYLCEYVSDLYDKYITERNHERGANKVEQRMYNDRAKKLWLKKINAKGSGEEYDDDLNEALKHTRKYQRKQLDDKRGFNHYGNDIARNSREVVMNNQMHKNTRLNRKINKSRNPEYTLDTRYREW